MDNLEDQRKHLVPHIEMGRVSSDLQRQQQSAGDPRLSIGASHQKFFECWVKTNEDVPEGVQNSIKKALVALRVRDTT